jgi:anti-sigma factor ChrR (cupin superfamily)
MRSCRATTRLSPGAAFTSAAWPRGHRHTGHERFLIPKGGLRDSDGTRLRAGDPVLDRDGTERDSAAPKACLPAVQSSVP